MLKEKPWTELAADIRARLGSQGVLLDLYLSALMRRNRAVSVARLVDLGISAASKLYRMCEQAVRKDFPEPFLGDADYHRVHEYVAANPLPYRGTEARIAVYFCRLFPAYRANRVEHLLQEIELHPVNSELANLTHQINAILGESATLEALSQVLSIQTNWQHLLHESMWDEYLRVLMILDPVAGRFVYQHLLEVYHVPADIEVAE